jgi:hypothetical protein
MTLLQENGGWTHKYSNFEFFNGSAKIVGAGQTQNYTISLRFTKSDYDYWAFTLTPYKDYFNSIYGSERNAPKKDLDIIRKLVFSQGEYNYTNPGNDIILRRYNWKYLDPAGDYDLLNKGFGAIVDNFVNLALHNGYKREIIWKPSGLYADDNLNYPPQFMDFIQGAPSDPAPFKKFGANGLSLMFWWGRSTQIPYNGTNILTENEWDAPTLVDADYNTLDHLAFLKAEMKKAVCDRGANGFGLDSFAHMAPYDRYNWVDDLRDYASNECSKQITLNGEGAQPDFIHSKIGNIYFPCKHVGLNGPDILSHYLNPISEIQVDFSQNFPGKIICDYDGGFDPDTVLEFEKDAKWGYTRYLGGDDMNINGLTLKESTCFDGADNDNAGDGIDFPFDPECTSFTDDSESA